MPFSPIVFVVSLLISQSLWASQQCSALFSRGPSQLNWEMTETLRAIRDHSQSQASYFVKVHLEWIPLRELISSVYSSKRLVEESYVQAQMDALLFGGKFLIKAEVPPLSIHQARNGDRLLMSSSLAKALYELYQRGEIDLNEMIPVHVSRFMGEPSFPQAQTAIPDLGYGASL